MHGVSAAAVTQALAKCGSCVDSFLFKILSGDERIARAQELLAGDPLSIRELAVGLFGEDADVTKQSRAQWPW